MSLVLLSARDRAAPRHVGLRSPRRAPCRTGLVRTLLAAVAAMLLPGPGAGAEEACWAPDSFRQSDRDRPIRTGIAAARVALPTDEPAPPPQSFRPVDGVVRRVDLPPGAPKMIALTFDLCETPFEVAGYQGASVDTLRANGVRATFFAGGKWMLTHPDRAGQIATDPLFEIASHAWEHRNFRIVTGRLMLDEIRGPQSAYQRLRDGLAARQCAPRPGRDLAAAMPERLGLFRFPFGACNRAAIEAVGAAGLIPVQWDVSSGDPDRHLSAAGMVASVLRRVRPGSIVLFHANGRGWATDEALPEIVARLRQQGYVFVTVGELLAYPGAKPVVAASCYDETPSDTDRYDGLARLLDGRSALFAARTAAPAGDRGPAGAVSPAPSRSARVAKPALPARPVAPGPLPVGQP